MRALSVSSELAAAREAMSRNVNDQVVVMGRGSLARFAIRCECSTSGCTDHVHVKREVYDRVRSVSTDFFVVPGHEDLELERVVEEHPSYLVVRKTGEAGEVAEALDTRD